MGGQSARIRLGSSLVGHTKAEWGSREEGDRKWGRMSVARELRTCKTLNTGTQGSEREGY